MSTRIVNIKSGAKYDIYIGRGSIFGNPYTHIKHKQTLAKFIVNTREESIEEYKKYFYKRIQEDEGFKSDIKLLKDRILGCFCSPEKCHGDIIKEYLDNLDK